MEGTAVTDKQKAKFKRLVKGLNDLMFELQDADGYPGANYYLAMETLHVMRGPSHDDGDTARQDRSMVSADLWSSGGGDW